MPRQSCEEGETQCAVWPTTDTVCVDLQTDNKYCGSCYTSCIDARPGMAMNCQAGECICESSGQPRCNGHIPCPDFQNNVHYCGSCQGPAATVSQAHVFGSQKCTDDQECRGGQCRDCGHGTKGCRDYDGVRGCVNVLTDPLHCGDCNRNVSIDPVFQSGLTAV